MKRKKDGVLEFDGGVGGLDGEGDIEGDGAGVSHG